MGSKEALRVTKQKDRSFAGQKLEILPSVQLKIPVQSSSRLIFLHPPKTGGTNLVFLSEALPAKFPNFKARRFAVPRVTNQSPGLIKENWQGGLQAALDALNDNPHCCDSLNFVSGHFPFGVHQYIKEPYRYIALIRDPIEREISNTNFDFQRGYVVEKDAIFYLLNSDIDNPQTRMLAGVASMGGECNKNTLRLAIRNVEAHFLLLGVTEDTNCFIQALASIQGWGPFALTRAQVTGDKVVQKLDPLKLEALKEKHKYDCLMYQFAQERWYSWKKAHFGPAIELPNEPLMCLTHEFASTKQPIFLHEADIERYNRRAVSGVIEVRQQQSDLEETISKNYFKYYGVSVAMLAVGIIMYVWNK